MTTNISESLNSAMLKARELPICSMLRNEVDYQVTDFTKTIEGILKEQIELSRSMKVNPVNNMNYQVIDGTSQYVIYLPMKWMSATPRRDHVATACRLHWGLLNNASIMTSTSTSTDGPLYKINHSHHFYALDIFLEYEGDDDDIVKLALVYFIELSLFGKDRRTKVDISFFKIADD
uniref:Uncharacterized protein n=1 Tax=Cucumis melo TaxID=3656 RepID=A0A9I9EJH5_CUCME